MRILMVLGRSTGGIGHHVGTLTRELRRLDHDVDVVTDPETASHFGWTDALRLWPLRRGPAIVRLPVDWHRVMRRAGRVDIVHAHGQQAAFVAAVAVLRARPRPKFVVSLHNDLPPDRRGGPAARAVGWALRRADLVTGASDDLVDEARALGARRSEPAPVSSATVSAALRHTPTADERATARAAVLRRTGVEDDGRPIVLTVSRLAPQKDLATLVAAARESTAPATWLVVGGGDEALRAELEDEVGGIPAGGARVHLVGTQPDVRTWLLAADVFTLSSRWEARSLAVQEAMATGLPVVVTEVGGLPRLVGDAGVLVPAGAPGALAAAVDELLNRPELAASLGAAARAAAARWEGPGEEAHHWSARYASLSGE